MALTNRHALTIGFVGAGRTATTMALGLAQAGYGVVAVASRNDASALRLAERVPGCRAVPDAQAVADAATLVFITTPDDAIGRVAASVAWHPDQSVVHCSGALTLEPLVAASERGAKTGSLHPVQTFGPVEQWLRGPGAITNGRGESLESFRGAAFGIEADGPLFDTLAEMARRLGGAPLQVPAGARPLYHAAAVLVCGYFVALFQDATRLWQLAGLPAESTAPALAHLVQGTLNNVRTTGVAASQTGPVSRGDSGTVRAHLQALAERAPELLPVYAALAGRTVVLAASTGRLPAAVLPDWEALLALSASGPGVNAKE